MIRYPTSVRQLLDERKALLACYVDTASCAVAEMAGLMGYDMVWFDMEHGAVSWPQAEHFCRAAAAGGAMPIVRIPDAQRVNVLHALDAGARFVIVPMVESPDTARELVRHGKYPPLGARGFSGGVRGLFYGLGDKIGSMAWANRDTHLFVQIETVTAVERCAEILAVEGISGGLVGPGDLSVSFGKPLAFDDPGFLALYLHAVRTIRRQGKMAATVSTNAALNEAGLEAGLQIVVCAGDSGSIGQELPKALELNRGLVEAMPPGGSE